MRYLLYILCLLFTAKSAIAQGDFEQEEVSRILSMPDDTAKVNRLNNYAQKIQAVSPVNAIVILDNAVAISRKLHYDYGLALAISLRSGMYFYEMKLDSSILLLNDAFKLLVGKKDIASKNLEASLFLRKAAIFQQQQNTDSAIHYYLQAASAYADNGSPEKGIVSFYNISGIYRSLNDTAQALFYARHTRTIAISANDSIYLLRSLIVIGEAFALAENYDSVFWSAQSGLRMETQLKMPFASAKFHDLLGQYYSNYTAKYDSAVYYFKAALKIFTTYNIPFDQALTLQHIGEVYLKKGDYGEAINYSAQATAIAKKSDLNQILYYTLKVLSSAYEQQGNYQQSNKHLQEFLIVADTLEKRNNRKMVMELEAKYQNQKKETQIAEQQKAIQKNNFTIYFLISGLVALGIVSLLFYINYRNAQKLQLLRIKELETEKQLTATEAVLKGEEQERSRLAKDLHDGLGGMLSGIKYAFQSIKCNLVMTPDNQQQFERSIDMLDSSIKEMRRVAHNMMPEALVKFGLDVALKDFCNDINQSGAINVIYQSQGLENAVIDHTTSITIFRIVQELINNTIKHAGATSALVQVDKANGSVTLTVEDDGKGFDTNILQQSRGIGWSNIQSRIEFLKGEVDVKSAEGKGTSVLIELKV